MLAWTVASLLAAFIEGCGDDDAVADDGSKGLLDSSRPDGGSGRDAASSFDAGERIDASLVVDAGEDDAALTGACSAAERDLAETSTPEEPTFYEIVAIAVSICELGKEPFEECVAGAIDTASGGAIGEACGACFVQGALCLTEMCGSCTEDPESKACEDCTCGRTEEAGVCMDAMETCADYAPNLCGDVRPLTPNRS